MALARLDHQDVASEQPITATSPTPGRRPMMVSVSVGLIHSPPDFAA
jgi:hypothetical protein